MDIQLSEKGYMEEEQFRKTHPNIFHSLSGISKTPVLLWTHLIMKNCSFSIPKQGSHVRVLVR